MVQLTRESSQGDGGPSVEYPAVAAALPQQPRPIQPQETPQHPASLEHHQPRPPNAHHPPQQQRPSSTGDGAASTAPQTHPPPGPHLKYPGDNHRDHHHHHHPPSGRHYNPSTGWNPTMTQDNSTNMQNPPPAAAAANAYYASRTSTTSRDNTYNHGGHGPPGKTSRTSASIRDHRDPGTHTLPPPRGRENSSSSSRNYGNYHPSDKENVYSGSNSSRHRSDRESVAYSDRDSSYSRNRSKYSSRDAAASRHHSGESYREMDAGMHREEDIKPQLSRHFEPIRNFGIENTSQVLRQRGRTESVASMSSVASSRAPPIGGSSRRAPGYYNDQYGQRDMYDQYSYYYQYYRDHPYYKEYYRQWMQQYGQQYPDGYNMEDRSSLHSGRSSVNDDMKPKSVNRQFEQDFHGQSSFGYEPSAIYGEVSLPHLKSYPSGDMSGVGSIPDESVNAARMTPLLFGRAHIKARFTPSGQLLVVLPKDPRDGEKANVQIRNIQKTFVSNPEMSKIIKKMQEFPGPLTIVETHKEVVVKYCERRIAEASVDCQLSDKSSVILMWEYLALLVRQNGRLYGTDIARLLLRGRNESSVSKDDHKDNENVATPSALNNEHQANFINSPDSGLSIVNTTDFDLGSTNSTEIPSVPIKNETELIKKFTEYLCLGRKKEALDYAIQEGLWGHCLALAAKMDSNTHTRVLIAFLNAIPRHNVLQTLFQQLSGKKPEITKTYSEERWGDWQSHLAMMISNPTGNTEKDQASVLSLGDTLAQRGQLHAAHFCYLLANSEWGSFSNKDSKIVLIGANHQLSFQEFASNESIQCTEIYEYGRSLEDKSNSLPSFQSYKLIYALRLAEAGLPQEALKYCEVISNVVEKSQTFPFDFLSQVYNLASCLKYNDVHYQMCQGELSEMPDPDWLIKLKQQLDNAISKQYAESVAAGYGSNISSDVVDQAAATTPHTPEVPPSYQQQVSTVSDTAVCNQSNNYVSGNYVSGNYDPHGSGHYHNDYANNVNTETNDNTQDQQLPMVPMVNPPNQQTEMESNSIPMMAPTHSYTDNGPSSMPSPQLSDFVGVPGEDSVQQHEQQQQQQQQHQHHQQQQQQQHWQMQPGSTEGSDNRESPADNAPPMMMAPPTGSMPPVQWQPGPPLGFMPPTSSALFPQKKPPEGPDDQDGNVSNSSSNKSKTSLDDSGSDSKKKEDKNQSGGFLSSIFNWKKSNQAILPDDKNPSIVWNEKTEKWESVDGNEEVVAPPPPPPKMGGGGPGAPAVTSLRRGAKKSRYVNLETSKVSSSAGGGALPPMPGGSNFNTMAPIAPMVPPQQPMMMPTPAASIPQSQDMDMPPTDNVHSHETDNQQQGAGSGNDSGIPMMAPPSGGGQIQFFNPAQMKSGVATSSGGGSQQRRLGANRRVYPTQ